MDKAIFGGGLFRVGTIPPSGEPPLPALSAVQQPCPPIVDSCPTTRLRLDYPTEISTTEPFTITADGYVVTSWIIDPESLPLVQSWSVAPGGQSIDIVATQTVGQIEVEAHYLRTAACPDVATARIRVEDCVSLNATPSRPAYTNGSSGQVSTYSWPAGGSFTWEVILGAERIDFLPNQTGSTFAFTAGAPNGPIQVRVTYDAISAGGVACSRTKVVSFQILPDCDTDSDGDTMSDCCEVIFGTNPEVPDDPTTLPDADNDGLADAQECTLGTNPHYFDSDNDGLPDGFEVAIGTDPLNPDTAGTGSWTGTRTPITMACPTSRSSSMGRTPSSGTAMGTGCGTARRLTRGATRCTPATEGMHRPRRRSSPSS